MAKAREYIYESGRIIVNADSGTPVVGARCYSNNKGPVKLRSFCPSTEWADGGPIIERERLHCIPAAGLDGPCWASFADEWGTERVQYGPTTLVAAMRAFVASRFGDDVDLP